MRNTFLKTALVLTTAACLALPAPLSAGEPWQGAYAGISIGHATGEGTHASQGSTTAYGTAKTDGTTFGLIAGYNIRRGQLVFGPEFEVATVSGSTDTFTHSSNTSSMTLGFDRALSGGVRLGYLVQDNALVFVTAGVAQNAYTASFATVSVSDPIVLKDKADGSYVGLGAEFRMDRGWSLRGEYRHYNGLSASNPDTNFPGSTTYLSGGTRDYDMNRISLSLVRQF